MQLGGGRRIDGWSVSRKPVSVCARRRSPALAAFVLVVVAVALAVGCGGSRSSSRVPLIVDTDLSSDDVVALVLAARDPRVELKAVSVSGTGLVHCPLGARRAAELLSALGRPDVPVACGRGVPLSLVHELPAEWRATADRMFGLELPPGSAPRREGAAALLRRILEEAGRPPTVLELAPMTNLARLVLQQPQLAGRIERVVAMGGAVSVPGNAPGDDAAETNVWLDPAAARVVLGSGVPVTLVPLDATNDVPVTASVSDVLKRYHFMTPAATIAWDVMLATGMDRGGLYFWDPLAAASVTRPALLRTAARRLEVTAEGRIVVSAHGPSVRVATGADRPAFERALLGTLLDGHPYTLAVHRAEATVTYTGSGCGYRGVHSLVAGPVTVDTVNRSSRSFTWVAGRLDPSHSFAELARWALDQRHAGRAPAWFSIDASGETPPRSRTSWRALLPTGATGTTIVACGTADPPRAWLVATIAVFASSR
jgi:pyrimidine-specific ribonucleoside hydrolase